MDLQPNLLYNASQTSNFAINKQIMSTIIQELNQWFSNQPKWLQVAANRLLTSGSFDDNAISELAELCLKADNEIPNIPCCIPPNAFGASNSEEIHLRSISDVVGVNKLAPRKPLDFGDSNIAVVYGDNGSGKSGYVRLLKHICGARESAREPLLSNVFESGKIAPKAKISYSQKGTLISREWTNSETCEALRAVDIFDTLSGSVFREDEGEVSYEPPVLSFFSELAEVCDRVGAQLEANRSKLVSKMPSIPNTLSNTTGAKWLAKLNAQTTNDEVETHCSFSEQDTKELEALRTRISEKSPADKAQQLRKKKGHIDNLISTIRGYFSQLSDDNCKQIISAKKDATLKKAAAEAAAADVFNGAKLDGVGNAIWKELWYAAQKYSEEIAYKGKHFPHVEDDSVCVLCHQSLSDEAKKRFTSFEAYIKGETQEKAVKAEKHYQQQVNDLPDILDVKSIRTKLDAAGVSDQNTINAIENTIAELHDRKSKVPLLDSDDTLNKLNHSPEWIGKLQAISNDYQEKAMQYDADAKKDNRIVLQEQLNNLEAKQWLAEQKQAIQNEICFKNMIDHISEGVKKTNTRTLSLQKGKLSEHLITEAFVERFNDELRSLGASKIKVKIAKTRTSKGKTFHAIRLIGVTNYVPNDILSEGESRIVSIAAFLADVTGKAHPTPFVFDDPISSLDQRYEEAVIQRLCTIAKTQQVIIFTHRLSLLVMTQDYAKNAGSSLKTIYIQDEPWGAGEPGNIPFSQQPPKKAINFLINDSIPKAEKCLRENGIEAYNDEHARRICRDFRVLVECIIEHELTDGIVVRNRRAINTQGKLAKLAKISKKDCDYFDSLMTRYSTYAHSQPLDTPVNYPQPNELKADFESMKKWLEEFKNRGKEPTKKS